MVVDKLGGDERESARVQGEASEAGMEAGVARRRRRLKIMLAIGGWLVMFAWSNIPPYRGNVLEQERQFFVWHWQLYSRGGEGICDVRYFDHNDDDAPIERWTLLGHERPGLMPDKLARTQKKDLLNEYRRACRAMRKAGDKQPDVRVRARCAEKGEWKLVERRKRNVCEIKASKSKPKPKKAGGK
jgi:hypothetical protein